MNVASLELSKELYHLSGWEYAIHQYLSPYDDEHPVYDLGFLLRKLPIGVAVKSVERFSVRKYSALYDAYRHKSDTPPTRYYTEQEMTPEDAVCKLAIDLFKDGILKKERER